MNMNKSNKSLFKRKLSLHMKEADEDSMKS